MPETRSKDWKTCSTKENQGRPAEGGTASGGGIARRGGNAGTKAQGSRGSGARYTFFVLILILILLTCGSRGGRSRCILRYVNIYVYTNVTNRNVTEQHVEELTADDEDQSAESEVTRWVFLLKLINYTSYCSENGEDLAVESEVKEATRCV
jgi:hypothetical protein